MPDKIWFTVDDFGNLWRFREFWYRDGYVRLHYQAPKEKLEDDLHDEWGGWK